MARQTTVIGTTRWRGGVLLSSELVEEENPRESNQTCSEPSGQHDHLSQEARRDDLVQSPKDG